jgi:hypothetical protein
MSPLHPRKPSESGIGWSCILGVLSRQRLKRRIPGQPTLRLETEAWEMQRNTCGVTVEWRFTTGVARISSKLYPCSTHHMSLDRL